MSGAPPAAPPLIPPTQVPKKCDVFEPQRFRPNFCKTCYKSKGEHPVGGGSPSDTKLIPPPLAPHPVELNKSPREEPVTPKRELPEPPRINSSTLQGEMNQVVLRKPTEIKKGSDLPQRKSASFVQSSIINQTISQAPAPAKKFQSLNVNRKSKKPTKIMNASGFIQKQQAKGEIPDANKFFLVLLRGMLQDGVGVTSGETEDLMRRIIAKSARTDTNPILLLNKQKMTFFLDHLDQAHSFLEEQQNLKSIITVQSLFRKYLVTKKFQGLSKQGIENLKTRNAVYIDIIRTEKLHVERLDELINNFVIKIRQSEFVQPHECAFIFSNIEVVAEEHRNLYKRLVAASDNFPFIGNIGLIFLDIKGLLNAISVYVGNFKNAMNEIERITSENPRFESFCVTVRISLFF